ncbi:MAG: hypothetical protein J6W40_04365, partial [Alphaproteobacteria bacterium]|nr:hypothetical protein [Alphaproteobacteria bacterium]
PAFADTVTTLPNNAVCNETNLGTSSGTADIEVAWEANTITTQWYTGYGENTAAANATTCTYDGTINLPQTNPSRPGYAFNGWKLRTPTVQSNPLANLNTSAEPSAGGMYPFFTENGNENLINGFPDSSVVSTYGLERGTAAITFDYGDVYIENSCNTTNITGNDFAHALDEAHGVEEEEQLISTFNFVTRSGDTFSRSVTGQMCWCRVYGYKPTNGTIQLTPDAPWVFLGASAVDWDSVTTCEEGCALGCLQSFVFFPRIRSVFYGQE